MLARKPFLMLLVNGATHFRDNGDVRFYLSARAL